MDQTCTSDMQTFNWRPFIKQNELSLHCLVIPLSSLLFHILLPWPSRQTMKVIEETKKGRGDETTQAFFLSNKHFSQNCLNFPRRKCGKRWAGGGARNCVDLCKRSSGWWLGAKAPRITTRAPRVQLVRREVPRKEREGGGGGIPIFCYSPAALSSLPQMSL